jgi:hypothetical protein
MVTAAYRQVGSTHELGQVADEEGAGVSDLL